MKTPSLKTFILGASVLALGLGASTSAIADTTGV